MRPQHSLRNPAHPRGQHRARLLAGLTALGLLTAGCAGTMSGAPQATTVTVTSTVTTTVASAPGGGFGDQARGHDTESGTGNDAAPGSSVNSVATVDDDGIIAVSAPDADDPVVIDMWEDSICPICADMEHQYGRQIAQAVDAGALKVRYHMVDFLNANSASGNYSTRAYAAMISVAKQDGSDPGLWLNLHSALFDSDNQPTENSSSDLSNDDLADIAGALGASEAAQDKISDGAQVDAAGEDAKANFDKLTAVAAKIGRQPGTPTVAQDGVPVSTRGTDWLTNLLPDTGTA